ncbi:MAG: hypothetical protein HKN47_19615 [Pirellulaceae bacterium]|nr:hypothetical protein [Pirellulaceae bacterium]
MISFRSILCSLLLLAANTAVAQEEQTEQGNTSQSQLVIVMGAEGEPEFGEQFNRWVDQWESVAKTAGVQHTTIGRSTVDGQDDRESLRATIASLQPNGVRPVWIVLIGHGTFTRQAAKFNLRGPDVSAKELAEWIQPIERPLVVINCSSSSGPFINQLSGKNRIVVTATKSGSQYNYARFGAYFANAITSLDSDLDHDDEISVHEAFLRASADVRNFYNAEARINTEHALIDDNGDKRGTPATMFRGVRAIGQAKDGKSLDGKQANRVTLAPTKKRLPLTDDEVSQREQLEQELEGLRDKKADMSESEYDQAIEPILIQLAKIYAAAEKRNQK